MHTLSLLYLTRTAVMMACAHVRVCLTSIYACTHIQTLSIAISAQVKEGRWARHQTLTRTCLESSWWTTPGMLQAEIAGADTTAMNSERLRACPISARDRALTLRLPPPLSGTHTCGLQYTWGSHSQTKAITYRTCRKLKFSSIYVCVQVPTHMDNDFFLD
jgi:hypothetical protein